MVFPGYWSDSGFNSDAVTIFGLHIVLLKYVRFCSYHCYAGAAQLYYTFELPELDVAVERTNSDLKLFFCSFRSFVTD